MNLFGLLQSRMRQISVSFRLKLSSFAFVLQLAPLLTQPQEKKIEKTRYPTK